MHINFLAASRIQAAIECLPRTCADDHSDRYSAGQGEIEMSKWQIFRHDYALGVRMPSDNKTTYGADRYITIGGFDRDNAAQMAEADRIVTLIADAPAMLDALADLLAYLEDGIGDHESEEGKQARALIAKHRGGK